MMTLTTTHIQTFDGKRREISFHHSPEVDFNFNNLIALPALIDPHVHFRTPGAEHKENWISGARAALEGGVTTVFDMPNNTPSCTSQHLLQQKRSLIQKQLENAGIPLRYHLYLGADKTQLHEISKTKDDAIAIKVFMGCSTGSLLIDDDTTLEEVFKIASDNNMLVAVHAEDEKIIQRNKKLFSSSSEPSIHSRIRDRTAAVTATEKAISLADKYRTRLYILHMSTKEEVTLVQQAKREGLPVFAEATPHHLFLNENAYDSWGTFVQMNPPLREEEDQAALWEGIQDNTIDTIGTDHAPHTVSEKKQPYGKAPSGVPSIELLLPLLLNAYHEGKLSLEKIVQLTRTNIEALFCLPPNEDIVLVNLTLKKEVQAPQLKSKCGWSPYHGMTLTGWPLYAVLQEKLFKLGGNEKCP